MRTELLAAVSEAAFWRYWSDHRRDPPDVPWGYSAPAQIMLKVLHDHLPEPPAGAYGTLEEIAQAEQAQEDENHELEVTAAHDAWAWG